MNYYLDTEFIEDFIHGTHFPSFRKYSLHYVDLISIGIVAEDGREYYAVNKEFDLKHVWNKHDLHLPDEMGDAPKKVYWLRENVLRPIYQDLIKQLSGDMKLNGWSKYTQFTYRNCRDIIQIFGKTKAEIAKEIQKFTADTVQLQHADMVGKTIQEMNKKYPPTFYGYYSDYDWVVFCSLFGRMLDLPKGYPMYCLDLKQDMHVIGFTKEWKDKYVPGDNEHHALADARWNKKLHEMMLKHAFLYSMSVNAKNPYLSKNTTTDETKNY